MNGYKIEPGELDMADTHKEGYVNSIMQRYRELRNLYDPLLVIWIRDVPLSLAEALLGNRNILDLGHADQKLAVDNFQVDGRPFALTAKPTGNGKYDVAFEYAAISRDMDRQAAG